MSVLLLFFRQVKPALWKAPLGDLFVLAGAGGFMNQLRADGARKKNALRHSSRGSLRSHAVSHSSNLYKTKEAQRRRSAKLAVKLNSLPQWGKVAREA